MTYQDAISHFGTQSSLAEKLGVSKQNITYYSRKGIPLLRQQQLEKITEGELKADPMPWEQPNVQPQ